uniref:Uncharacterized protein n=1 Tax=Pygocentrus nattereri TaxID=42514 RepID=A0A3B4C0Q5_PYGNA
VSTIFKHVAGIKFKTDIGKCHLILFSGYKWVVFCSCYVLCQIFYCLHLYLFIYQVTKSMAGVVQSMDATLKSMDLEKFECQFETLDVQTAQMEDTMGNSTTLTTPQVLQPIASVIILLDLNMELPQGQTGAVGTSVASAEQVNFSAWRLTDQSHAL